MFERPPPKYSAETVLKILLNPLIDKSTICTSRPIVIKQSSTFVVDITKLGHPDDIKSDNFGVWSHSGSHPVAFKVHTENGYVEVDKLAAGATGNDIVYLRRLHSIHPSNKDFKRMIAFISGERCILSSSQNVAIELFPIQMISTTPKITHVGTF